MEKEINKNEKEEELTLDYSVFDEPFKKLTEEEIEDLGIL